MTPDPLRIVFMGNPDFAVPTLAKLHESRHHVTAAVTGTDKRRGRGGSKSPSPVKAFARQHNIPVIETDDIRAEAFTTALRDLQPDLFIVVAFKILPPEILAIPSTGSLNLHASLLPRYRGAAPIHHALINGEKETGCTVFLLDEGMDTGLILNQETIAVDLLETTGEVYNRLKESGAELMLKSVDELSAGTHTPIPQDGRLATPAPKVSAEDARIDFSRDCMDVHNLIRGMSPFPAAWTTFEGKKIKILRSKPAPGRNIPAWKVVLDDGDACAGCGSGSVVLLEVQPEGKKRVAGREFLNGFGGEITFTW